ncbi:hypothetical protein M5689_006425 [Euphorbia peplus]|nr:hypothetical protein M5689_006425 [Euphorbia peplus]
MATTSSSSTMQSDIRCALHLANRFIINPNLIFSRRLSCRLRSNFSSLRSLSSSFRIRAFSTDDSLKLPDKPPICSADELHYVSVPNSDWRLALWRYHPSEKAPARNHPLLLLSGVGTNAIGYDLSPGCSFARYMSGQGFDTWILEVRGAGLSIHGTSPKGIQQSANEASEEMEAVAKTVTTNGAFSTNQQPTNNASDSLPNQQSTDNGSDLLPNQQSTNNASDSLLDSKVLAVKKDLNGIATVWDESKLVAMLTETFMRMSETLSGFLSEGQAKIISDKLFDRIAKLLEDSHLSERFNEIRLKLLNLLESRQNSVIASQIRDLSQRLVNVFEEGQRSVSPQLFDLQERLSAIIVDFQKQLDLIVKYDWDFDNYLEEDIPAVMEYIRAQTKPKDGKLHAIGHSMGGILLYAMLSRCGCEGRDSGVASVVTLASSLDYRSSNSKLKLLLPLADPAQALNVPVVPLGALLSAAYPLSSRPPYVLSWLNNLISAQDMMHPEMLEKLVLNNFCTIPAKLLLQLTTAFREGGLCDRSGKFMYKDHLDKCNVPVLALAGDLDLICPPEAVEETAKLMPEHLVTYKVFGEPGGPHYAHYDLVGGRLAVEQVYPYIIEFLSDHD